MSEFSKKMKLIGESTIKRINESLKDERFLHGKHTKKKLTQSLNFFGEKRLIGKTLLDESVRLKHSLKIKEKFISRYKQVIKPSFAKSSDIKKESERLRFATIINDIQPLDELLVKKSVNDFKLNLLETIKKSKGIWFLGCIELEIISIKYMKMIYGDAKEDERVKFDVCKKLIDRLPKSKRNADSYFLIHCHALVSSNKEINFKNFRDNLNLFKSKGRFIWSAEKRQIQIKKLSESFAGKSKNVERNLSDIADYITKGGNDWNNKVSYLNYKLGFENHRNLPEELWDLKDWRKNETLRKEHKSEGLIDSLSLTRYEIMMLATCIHNMMEMNTTKTGYVVFGRTRK